MFVVSLVLSILLVAPPARAGWAPARATRYELGPYAASALAGGEMVVWAIGPEAHRLVWPPGAVDPRASGPLPFASGWLPEAWRANRRGDVLMHAWDRALVVEAGGLQAALIATVPPGDAVDSPVAAIGEDGTAVVAWLARRSDGEQDESMVWLRVRAPGGQFGPVIGLAAPGPVGQVAADVGADGGIELLYAWRDGSQAQLVHADVGADSVPGPAVTVATTSAAESVFAVVAGGPGVGRVVFADIAERDHRVIRPVVLSRTSATAWAARQVLEWGSGEHTAVLRALGRGGAVFAYDNGNHVLVRRAAAGAPFESARRVGRVPRGWRASDLALASTPRGDVLVAWREHIPGVDSCGGASCFDRVVAAFAEVGRAFRPAQALSRVGTKVESPIVAALSERGGRLVAWQAAETDGSAPRALWVALGDATADPRPRSDRRAPRVTVTATRRALRAAARSGRLRMRLRSDEACAVRVWIDDLSGPTYPIDDLRAIVLRRAKTTTAAWSLGDDDRRLLRSGLRNASLFIIASATDAAGNLRYLRVGVRGYGT